MFVFNNNELLDLESVVRTDSHRKMIYGLGHIGWGVGGMEAEAVILSECTPMVLLEVVGFKTTGNLPKTATATDLILTCTEMLRKRGEVGIFLEFYRRGLKSLILTDRARVAVSKLLIIIQIKYI